MRRGLAARTWSRRDAAGGATRGALAALLAGLVLAACGPSSTSSISGTVLGEVTEGVTVTLSGAGSATATTDATGFYAFTDLSGGNYTVTPSRTGYSFLPASREVSVFGTLIDQVNFVSSVAAADGPIAGGASVVRHDPLPARGAALP